MCVEEKVNVITLDVPALILDAAVAVSLDVHYSAKGVTRRVGRNRASPRNSSAGRDSYTFGSTAKRSVRIHRSPPPVSVPAAALATFAVAGGEENLVNWLHTGRRRNPRAPSESKQQTEQRKADALRIRHSRWYHKTMNLVHKSGFSFIPEQSWFIVTRC